ncbi:MAG: carbonic anhydrase [Fimbriimonadaceae bacterium]
MIASLTVALQLTMLNAQISTKTTTQTSNAVVAKKLNPYAENAFRSIVEGNARFSEGLKNNPRQSVEARLELAKGQAPHTIIVTCADSRLSPEIIFDQGLGDVFVIRVAGNVVDQFSIASIEYAAEHLHAPLLIVLGHERCGAVNAAVETYESHLKNPAEHTKTANEHGESHASATDEHANIAALIHEIMPSVMEAARKTTPLLATAIDINVENSINVTVGRSPLLRRLAEESKFDIIGGVYDLDTGRVTFSPPNDVKSYVRIARN